MIFKIPVDLYKSTVHIIIDEPDDASMRYVKRIAGTDCEYIVLSPHAEAVTVRHEYGFTFVRFQKDYKISFVAHELLHVVFYILNRKGMEYNEGSEEAYTYLLEYLMEQFERKTRPRT